MSQPLLIEYKTNKIHVGGRVTMNRARQPANMAAETGRRNRVLRRDCMGRLRMNRILVSAGMADESIGTMLS